MVNSRALGSLVSLALVAVALVGLSTPASAVTTVYVVPNNIAVAQGAPAPTYTFTYRSGSATGDIVVPGTTAGYPAITGTAPTCSSTYSPTTLGLTPASITCSGGSDVAYAFNVTTTGGLSVGPQVAAGALHSCALPGDGTVRCWGANVDGQLGNGTLVDSPVPVSVGGGVTTAVAVTAGDSHSCALLSDRSLVCWGSNSSGQLGDGTTLDSQLPVAVQGLGGPVAQVSAGSLFTCALMVDRTAKCWGYGFYGQLGDGNGGNDSAVPVAVSGVATAVAVSAGDSHACAVLSTGSVLCWGSNSVGQLGNNSLVDSLVPVTVSSMTTAVSVSAGFAHTCAVLSTKALKCWGDNFYGQLGNNSVTDIFKTPVSVSGISTGVSVTAGGAHSCAVLTTGSMKCWGDNSWGQLGDGTIDPSLVPVAVAPFVSGVRAASGGSHTCAARSTGVVQCWGFGGDGELGDGTYADSLIPVVALAGPATVTAASLTLGVGVTLPTIGYT